MKVPTAAPPPFKTLRPAKQPPQKNQARRAGVRCYERSSTSLRRCHIIGCGGPAVLLQEAAAAKLDQSVITACNEEGVAASAATHAELRRCAIKACGGPAVDASGRARVLMVDCELSGCIGGLWLWDGANAHAERTLIAAASSFAVLLDADAHASSGGANSVDGPVLVAEPGGLQLPCKTTAATAVVAAAAGQLLEQQLSERSLVGAIDGGSGAVDADSASGRCSTGLGSGSGTSSAIGSAKTTTATSTIPESSSSSSSSGGGRAKGVGTSAEGEEACGSSSSGSSDCSGSTNSLVQAHTITLDPKARAAAFPPETAPFVFNPPSFA